MCAWYCDRYAFRTGDYTLECWLFHPAGYGASGTGCGYDDKIFDGYSHFRFGFKGYGHGLDMGGEYFGSSAQSFWQGQLKPAANTWHHYVWQREGGTASIYYDGNRVHEEAGNYDLDGSGGFAIGATPDGGECSNVWIDEVRISKGIARYSANFDPTAMKPFGKPPDPPPKQLFYLDEDGQEYVVTLTKVSRCPSVDAAFHAYLSEYGDGVCWLRSSSPDTAIESCTGVCASAGMVDAPVAAWATALSDNVPYRTALRDAHCPGYLPKQFETGGGNNYCKISPYCQKWSTPNYWACHATEAITKFDVDSSWADGNPSARSCPCL